MAKKVIHLYTTSTLMDLLEDIENVESSLEGLGIISEVVWEEIFENSSKYKQVFSPSSDRFNLVKGAFTLWNSLDIGTPQVATRTPIAIDIKEDHTLETVHELLTLGLLEVPEMGILLLDILKLLKSNPNILELVDTDELEKDTDYVELYKIGGLIYKLCFVRETTMGGN